MTEKLAEIWTVSSDFAAVLAPLFAIYFIVIVIAILDLARNWKERSLQLFWILIILLITPIGPVLYLLIGRRSPHDPTL